MKYYILRVEEGAKRDLGPSIFYDAGSGLIVTSKDANAPVAYEGPMTKKIEQALKNSHIVEVKAPKGAKVQAAADASTTVPDFTAMTDEELLTYYKENWDVTAKDEKAFVKMTTEEKVAFLSEE